jgi:hypothetical protein
LVAAKVGLTAASSSSGTRDASSMIRRVQAEKPRVVRSEPGKETMREPFANCIRVNDSWCASGAPRSLAHASWIFLNSSVLCGCDGETRMIIAGAAYSASWSAIRPAIVDFPHCLVQQSKTFRAVVVRSSAWTGSGSMPQSCARTIGFNARAKSRDSDTCCASSITVKVGKGHKESHAQ